jgi:ribosomal protein L15
VDLFSLKDKKVVKIPKSKKNIKVKILSKGELTKKLIFSSELLFSQKAKEKIINSGSSIE